MVARKPGRRPWGNLKVVLIDANPRVRADLRQLLSVIPRIDISEAADGPKGLALVRETRPALVLLDLEAEGLEVEELLRTIRIENPGTRAVVLSGRSGSSFAKRALNAGAAGYVRKSASSHERLRTVRRVAEGGHYIEAEVAQVLALDARPVAVSQGCRLGPFGYRRRWSGDAALQSGQFQSRSF